jgi:hypothetical protein
MKTLGILLLMAASATAYGDKPHVANMLFRNHVVAHGAPPASGPVMAPPGAGADAGGGVGFGANRRFPNDTSQIYFVDPAGMQIGWQTTGGTGMQRTYLPAQLTVPARYNFRQGFIYRLKLGSIPNRPGLTLYPSLEIAPSTPATDAYLTHNPIPAQFTEEDFDQVTAGNFVTKVIYLPDPKYQELAIAGVETLVSTRLEPGVDPILEADRRGTILMIMRIGAIDLEMPATGLSGAPGTAVVGPEGTILQDPINTIDSVPPPAVEIPTDAGEAPVSPAPATPVVPTPPAPGDVELPAAPPTASRTPIERNVEPVSLPAPVLPDPGIPSLPPVGGSGL